MSSASSAAPTPATPTPTFHVPPSHSSFVTPLLTDLYQISMSYAYWKAGRQNEYAVFDVFFRKNPFKGQYTMFAGLEEVS